MPTHPLVALAANLFLEMTGEGEGDAASTRAEYPDVTDIPGVQELRNRRGAVITLVGRPMTGKTTLAHSLAAFLARPTYAVSPHERPPSWITPMPFEALTDQPPPGSVVILDDILSYMSSDHRDRNQRINRQVEKIFPTARHDRGLILICCTQVTSLMDKYGLRADAVALKPPDLLFADIERPGVRRRYREIEWVWQDRSDWWIKRHAYLLTSDWEGIVRVRRMMIR